MAERCPRTSTFRSAYSRFRRIEFQGRVLLLVTYRVGSRVSGVKEEDQPNVEQRLAIIDESTGMTRYDFLLDSNRFELVRTDTTLGVVSINDASILLRRLEFRGDAMTASEPILLASSNHGIDRLAVENEPDRSIHLAWLTERVGAMPERAVRYLYFKPDDTRRNLNLPFPNEESDGFRQFPRDSKLEDPEGVPFTETARGGLLNMRLNDQMLWVYWVDSRFVWRGFERKNYSKLMTQPVLIDGKPQQSLAINIPKDDSDNADEPWLLWSHENAQFFAWSHASGGEPQEVLLQLSALDLETRNLRLARQPIHFRNIVAEAVHQNVEYERTRPVPDHPVPDSDECDNWEERLNLKPTGFGIMTPEGEQPITRLGTKKNGDNDQG